MRAVVYADVRTVEEREVPDATVETETDAVVRITSTALCGTDLHMYDGRTSATPGWCSDTNPWVWCRRWAVPCRPSGRAPGW
ncbi:alcohol dehydrogenase catalytic domain-containing protein [Micromonospora sp. M12]